MGQSARTDAASSCVFCDPENLACAPPCSISNCANLSLSFHLVGQGATGSSTKTGARSMTSCVKPRYDPAILWRLTLLELVESDPAFDEWADRYSRCAASFALCASCSFSACFEPRRYEGTKKGGMSWAPPPSPCQCPLWLEYDGSAPPLPQLFDMPLW